MANLLVMMEFYRGALLPVSLEALGQARRLGSTLGLTVYALVALPPEPAEDEDITVRCGRFGADKVLLLTGDALFAEHEMRFEQYADALIAACTTLPPRLLLMGDTPAARDIVPRLAARIGAAYLPRGAALVVDRRLVLCDAAGRHLRIPLESPAEGIPPLTIPVMMTVPAGRHEMAWGDQDAELMIVPPQDDSSQTLPNLTVSSSVRQCFVEEALEPLPLRQRVAYKRAAASRPDASSDENGVTPLWQVCLGGGSGKVEPVTTPWWIHIGPKAEPAASYQLLLPEKELEAAEASLRHSLASLKPMTPIKDPGSPPPLSRSADGFEDSTEFTPTAESWDDYSGDTLTGDDEASLRIRVALAEQPQPPLAIPHISSAATPPVGSVEAPLAPLRFVPAVAPATAAGAAMWEGFATLPDDDSESQFEVASADTAPVPVVAPAGGKPKEGA